MRTRNGVACRPVACLEIIGFMSATDTTPAIPVTLPDDAPRVTLHAASAGRNSVYEMHRPVAIVGSRRDCDIAIEHADCSKVHAAIINTGRQVFVFDLNSRTGTFVNDAPIKLQSVVDGDTLRIAGRVLTLAIRGGGPRDDEPRLSDALCLVAGEARHQLTAPVSLIGRRTNCDVHVDHPDVSLAHALVFEAAGCLAIFDLGSRGGTTVSGRAVSLAWLRHEDRIQVGDESLLVEWSGAAPPSAAPPALTDDFAAGLPDLSDADLADIEQTIAAFQANLATSKRKLDEQAELLAARERELEALVADVERARAELTQREQSLAKEEADFQERRTRLESLEKERDAALAEITAQRESLDAARREVEEVRAALDSRAAALGQREAALAKAEKDQQELTDLLDKERAEVEATRGELERTRAEIDAAREAARKLEADAAAQVEQFEIRQADLDARAAELEARQREQEAALAQRARELEDRARDLDLRAEELREEREEFDAKQERFEKARTALKSATRLFSVQPAAAGSRLPSGESPTQPPGPSGGPVAGPPRNDAAPAIKPAAPAGAAGDAAGGETRPAAVPRPAAARGAGARSATKPAPPVESPAPRAVDAAPPPNDGAAAPVVTFDQLPPEQQERFRVLKRISGKGDAEIIAQLESEAKSRPTPPPEEKGRKSKRGWWS